MMQGPVSSEEMRLLEHQVIAGGICADILMENAGRLIAQQILNTYDLKEDGQPVTIVCGAGNNGGDGLVTARYLMEHKIPAVCFIVPPSSGQYKELVLKNIKRAFVCHTSVKEISDIKEACKTIAQAPLVIDALLGLGANKTHKPNPLYEQLCACINENGKTISIDGPTGIDMDDGLPYTANPVKAKETYTLGRIKKGLLEQASKPYVGKLVLLDIFSGIACNSK